MKLFDIRYDVHTAGPGSRTEIYLSGCSKAVDGHPCKGCFNKALQSGTVFRNVTPLELALEVIRKTPNKLVSFCGGEPTDQLPELIETCTYLKKAGFHILVYTYHTYTELKNTAAYHKLFQTIDILIDGAYDETKRIYDTKSQNWKKRSIGSSNQQVVLFERGKNIAAITS